MFTLEKKNQPATLCITFPIREFPHKGVIEQGDTGAIVSQRLVSPSQGLHLSSQIPLQHSAEVKWNAVGDEFAPLFDPLLEQVWPKYYSMFCDCFEDKERGAAGDTWKICSTEWWTLARLRWWTIRPSVPKQDAITWHQWPCLPVESSNQVFLSIPQLFWTPEYLWGSSCSGQSW